MLQLHERLTLDQAIAELGDSASAEFCCDGQFAVLPNVILCAFTGDGMQLASPSVVAWKPQRMDCEPGDPFPWLPRKVRAEPQDPKRTTHHILLRRSLDQRFLYAGEAHLGSYGGADPVASFHLIHKLPRSEWLALGGYPGWQIEANHHRHHVNEEDIRSFDEIVKDIQGAEFSHLEMTRYEEDSLTVFTNAARGWLMYLRTPDDGGLYVEIDVPAEGRKREFFRCVCGVTLDFETRNTLGRDVALAAAREFFLAGKLPQGHRWSGQ